MKNRITNASGNAMQMVEKTMEVSVYTIKASYAVSTNI